MQLRQGRSAYHEVFEAGYVSGSADGYGAGHKQGHAGGAHAGYSHGHERGYADGHEDGYDSRSVIAFEAERLQRMPRFVPASIAPLVQYEPAEAPPLPPWRPWPASSPRMEHDLRRTTAAELRRELRGEYGRVHLDERRRR